MGPSRFACANVMRFDLVFPLRVCYSNCADLRFGTRSARQPPHCRSSCWSSRNPDQQLLRAYYAGKQLCPLSRCHEIIGVAAFSRDRLAFSVTELIQDRGSTPSIGIFTSMGQQLRDLLPAPLGPGPFECEGLRHRLTGHGQTPGMLRGLNPEHVHLRGPRLHRVSVGRARCHIGGDARGIQGRPRGTRPLSVDLV
jgi:hypothetical protein